MFKKVFKTTIVIFAFLTSTCAFSQSITVTVEESFEVEVDDFQIFLKLRENTPKSLRYVSDSYNNLVRNEFENILRDGSIQFIIFEEDVLDQYNDEIKSTTFSINITNQNDFDRIKKLSSEYDNVSNSMKYFEILNEENVRAELYQKLIKAGKVKAKKIANSLNLELGEISNINDLTGAFGSAHDGAFISSIGHYNDHSTFKNEQYNIQTIYMLVELTIETTSSSNK